MILGLLTSASLAVPPEPGVIAPAIDWIERTVLGTLATVVAVLAVATCGFLMLQGRLAARRAVTVVAGCFVLFGAASIARGLRATVDQLGGIGSTEAAIFEAEPMQHAHSMPKPRRPLRGDDPYAGAAVEQ
jgi:type IV secretion system protein VirB2